MYEKKRINALYCRVSTDGQQTGLESQIRALKDWCVRNQITEYELFADEGISGAKESRPALNRLMEMVERNEVDQVIVFSFSRFARSTSHLLKGLKTFTGYLDHLGCACTARKRNDHRARSCWNG